MSHQLLPATMSISRTLKPAAEPGLNPGTPVREVCVSWAGLNHWAKYSPFQNTEVSTLSWQDAVCFITSPTPSLGQHPVHRAQWIKSLGCAVAYILTSIQLLGSIRKCHFFFFKLELKYTQQWSLALWIILNIQFSGTAYIRNAVQPSPCFSI